MNRARRELDRLSSEAWRKLVDDVRRAGKNAGLLVKKHPILSLGGGAVLGGLSLWTLWRRAPGVGTLGGLAKRLVRGSGVGVARALLSRMTWPAKAKEPG
jgi:hypothetical protein